MARLPDDLRADRQIGSGLLHACVLTDAGAVQCWGSNDLGKLGDGTEEDSVTAVDVRDGVTVSLKAGSLPVGTPRLDGTRLSTVALVEGSSEFVQSPLEEGVHTLFASANRNPNFRKSVGEGTFEVRARN